MVGITLWIMGNGIRNMTIASQQLTTAILIAFEERVADAFRAKQIHAPIHLSRNNEDQLIDIFKNIREQDWVFTTWRSHYHALLKGVPAEELYQEILAGRSMYLNFPAHRIVASSIMGGILPIAVGMAMGIQRKGLDEKVWVFIGDMAAHSGIFQECRQYVDGHDLLVHFVFEDNGLSTNTPTQLVWGAKDQMRASRNGGLRQDYYYEYERGYPHTGVGEWVSFG